MPSYLNTTVLVELTPMTCPASDCGVTYALDEKYRAKRREDGKSWQCPNGHSLSCRDDWVKPGTPDWRAHLTKV